MDIGGRECKHRWMQTRLDQISELSGLHLTDARSLPGGEQGGATLATSAAGPVVIKIQQDPAKAARLLAVAPIVMASQSRWAVARWLAAAPLPSGAFYLQEFIPGPSLDTAEASSIDAVIAANGRQRGLGAGELFDHSTQILAVASGQHAWFEDVARRSRSGASVAGQALALVASAGATSLPNGDIVHGDLSASNIIIDRRGHARFIDSESVGRGHRALDLADLYRQCAAGDSAPASTISRLVSAGVASAGVSRFITCVVGAALNNLAWHAANRALEEFEWMCGRVQRILERIQDDCTDAVANGPSR